MTTDNDREVIMESMPIRIMDFEIDQKLVLEALPEVYPAYGVSMTLPCLQSFLVRTLRAALKLCTDEEVAKEVRQLIGQEAQHYKQHAILNDIIRSISPALGDLRQIEEQMEADYKCFTQTKSLRFNLAYAEGFEVSTFAGGRKIFKNNVFDRLKSIQGSDLLRLFKWHDQEQIEHRTVTFNIDEDLFGGYFYRLAARAFGQYHFFKYVALFSKLIAKNAPHAPEQGHTLKPGRNADGELRERLSLLVQIARVYLPFYNPAKIPLPPNAAKQSKIFTAETNDIRHLVT